MLPNDAPVDTSADGASSVTAAWSRRGEVLSVALWISFIVAGVETMVVFALVDPVALGFDGLSPSLIALRPAIYAAGFFFFWLFVFLAASLTAYMFESGRQATPAAADSSTQRPSIRP